MQLEGGVLTPGLLKGFVDGRVEWAGHPLSYGLQCLSATVFPTERNHIRTMLPGAVGKQLEM